MDDRTQLLLEEWKARYESYRAYRAQYLTTISLAVTGVAVAVGLAFQQNIPIHGRRLSLSLACFVALGLVVAHIFARRTIRDLGERLRALEASLKFEPFRTTWMLETSLVFSLWVSVLVFGGLLLLLLLVWNSPS